jgi:hypothetical protein
MSAIDAPRSPRISSSNDLATGREHGGVAVEMNH